MVFSSIPAYLDPSNWHQQQSHQIIGGRSSSGNPLLPPPPQPPGPPQGPPPPPQHPQPPHGGGGAGSVRPGSMSERARMANISMPETCLKCPRCDSANTKFCYFNNYSLTQPRHFCKTCRRYWTRGGALRNVPVGGGCRRNKRSKSSSSSKSPASSERQTSTNPTSTSTISTNNGVAAAAANNMLPPLRFMSPLGQLTTDNFAGDMGLNYSGMTTAAPLVGATNEMNFHGITSNLMGPTGGLAASLMSSGDQGGGGNIEPWRLQQVQQFPFFGGFDSTSPGMYQFYGGESGFMGGGMQAAGSTHNQVRASNKGSSSSSVKMEENPAELNLSRQLLGGLMAGGNHEQWINNNTSNISTPAVNWTELSSNFSSSSTSNPV